MDYETYEDIAEMDEDMDVELYDEDEGEEYEEDEVNEMLESLMSESIGDEEDLAERRRRKSRRHRRGRAKGRGVRTARGRSAYRAPLSRQYVTQIQLKNALGRVGKDVRRNALGIKSVSKKISGLDTRVDGVVSVNTVQSKHIRKLDKQMKLDGALDFAQSVSADTEGNLVLDLSQLLKGAVKSGMLGTGTGALSNPAVIGGLGFLLNNRQIFGGLLSSAKI